MHHVGKEHLGNTVFLTQIHALFSFVGDVQEHEASFVNLCCAVGQHPANALAVGQALTESHTINHLFCGEVEGALCHSNVVHTVAQAAVGEAVLTHVEALTAAPENVLPGYAQIFNFDF